ncbi:MAG: hypothetical protein ACK5JH_12190 [Anaerocolumna sp.]
MCGRYYVDDETSREIRKILEQVDNAVSHPSTSYKKSEIFPMGFPILSVLTF